MGFFCAFALSLQWSTGCNEPEATNYGLGWWKYEDHPGLLIDSGRFGARSLLHPAEDWGAIFIMEATSDNGSELRRRLVPVIRAAVLAAEGRS